MKNDRSYFAIIIPKFSYITILVHVEAILQRRNDMNAKLNICCIPVKECQKWKISGIVII